MVICTQENPFRICDIPEKNATTFAEVQTTLFHANSPNDPSIKEYRGRKGTLYNYLKIPHVSSRYKALDENALLLNPPTRSLFGKMKDAVVSFWKQLIILMSILAKHLPFLQFFFSSYVAKRHDRKEEILMDWHSTYFQLAVATAETRYIFFYDCTKELFLKKKTIMSDYHRGITCLRWRPKSKSILGVGSKFGICVWNVDAKIGQQQGAYRFLPMKHVEDISWSRDDYLIACSRYDHRVVIWKVSNWSKTYVSTFGGGIEKCRFSPSNNFFVASSFDGILKLWNTKSQRSEKWKQPGDIQTMCWSQNDEYLIYALTGDSRLHILQMTNYNPPEATYQLQINLEEFTHKGEKICGNIHRIRIDRNRMAISFQDSPLIALFQCDFSAPGPVAVKRSILPIGLIRGPPKATKVIAMEFFENFPERTLLSVAWFPLRTITMIKLG